MFQSKSLARLESLFKEEKWGRLEPKDVTISKFRILDDLYSSLASENVTDQAEKACLARLKEQGESVISLYLLGITGYESGRIEYGIYLRRLTDIFTAAQKWSVCEFIAEKILEYGENSGAYRTLALSLEKMGRGKAAVPVWGELLRIDRFDADVAWKLAVYSAVKDPEKSVQYMKQAIEGYIRAKNFRALWDHKLQTGTSKKGEDRETGSLSEIWNKFIPAAWKDLAFFERIERMLVENRQTDIAAAMLKALLDIYKAEKDTDTSVELLKKILNYRPEDEQCRFALVRLYREKYRSHPQLEAFIKFSGIKNTHRPIRTAVKDFENYIIFAAGNYVFHNSWKIGKISSINSETVSVNFRNSENHQMSVQMALQSLIPVSSDSLHVRAYEDPDGMKKMFSDDFMSFFEILIKSYGGEISLADIKQELIPDYIDDKSWAKWWNRARTQIKKSPMFGVSEKKKDLFFMRDKPVTYVDELLDKFSRNESFSARLDLAIEFASNIDEKESADVVQYFTDYFMNEVKGISNTRLILSYFILKTLENKFNTKLHLEPVREKVVDFIKSADDLPLVSMKIGSYDYKKDFVSLIEESREDWSHVVSEMLFETPVKVHRYIFNTLVRARSFNTINVFIDRVITGYRQSPEIFLWTAKSIFTGIWEYEWLDYSRKDLTVNMFRLMNDLRKLETDSNRLKNQLLDILFSGDAQVLKTVIRESDMVSLSRGYDVMEHASWIEDSMKEKFCSLIKEKFPEFVPEHIKAVADDQDQLVEKFIVSRQGWERKKAELESMGTTEMNQLSRELASVAEASADPRENVEYAALMEKQTILKMAIAKLDREMKSADILDPSKISTDSVTIGTKVGCISTDSEDQEILYYTVLGPWDADFGSGIISYRSPIAKALLGRKLNDEFILRTDDSEKKFRILSIEKADF